MNNLKSKLFGGTEAESKTPERWRVNFVNAEALPDIKIIRTAFVVNYGLAIAALCIFAYAARQEVIIADIASESAKINAQADAMTATDTKIREKAALFTQYSAAVDEYVKLKTGGLDVFALYAQLGELRVDDVTYDNVLVDAMPGDAKRKIGAKIVISGKRKGLTKQSFERIETLYGKFTGMPYLKTLKGYEVKYAKSPTTIPDNQEQLVQFTFQLTLEPKS